MKADPFDKQLETLVKMHANPKYRILADHKLGELTNEFGEKAMRVRMLRILRKMRMKWEIR